MDPQMAAESRQYTIRGVAARGQDQIPKFSYGSRVVLDDASS